MAAAAAILLPISHQPPPPPNLSKSNRLPLLSPSSILSIVAAFPSRHCHLKVCLAQPPLSTQGARSPPPRAPSNPLLPAVERLARLHPLPLAPPTPSPATRPRPPLIR